MPADIQHVVVLMLENRSFDCMLGRLYPQDPDYRGLTLNESNTYGMTYGVWNDPNTPVAATIPNPDPGEAFSDINTQLFGIAGRTPAGKPDMSGFALNYGSLQTPSSYRDPGAVMHYFSPEQLPVLSTLARQFGVCDYWHASAPCQTWPNRFFAHTGTAGGYVDNHTFPVPFEAPSLFRRMEDCGKSWRVYFHDMPQSILLRDVWDSCLLRYRFFSQFLADAHTGSLPAYSFIEPQYFTDLFSSRIPNDEHPPHNVLYGEQLIAQVYNAVRSSPCWKQTLLIITYDEHGGCYDHIGPPSATPPDGDINNADQFDFSAYGVRVPAVIVSPWVAPGSKIRPTRPDADPPFDHTSIIRTVRETFALGAALSARDAVAPSLMPALSLAAPNNDGPASLTAQPDDPDKQLVWDLGAAAPNDMQASLAAAAATLPASAPTGAAAVALPAVLPSATYLTVALARVQAIAQTKRFLAL